MVSQNAYQMCIRDRVGHEMVDMGVTENYAGDWPVKALLTDVIQKLNWILFFRKKLEQLSN